ncbi:MAG: alternative oxidase, partial [Sphingobium sp.]|nr:alternative oxidase [Sphingobium sp.]
ERMHLMTFIEIAKPTWFERMVILGVQGVFLVGFSVLYLLSRRTAHRVVGYFEEEAVTSYTLYLQEIDEGRSPNVAAPAIARHYWQLPADATLRDVVLVVRDDEAHHRDVNHGFASTLGGRPPADRPIAPYPLHDSELRPVG